jgi:hypothetical protein
VHLLAGIGVARLLSSSVILAVAKAAASKPRLSQRSAIRGADDFHRQAKKALRQSMETDAVVMKMQRARPILTGLCAPCVHGYELPAAAMRDARRIAT